MYGMYHCCVPGSKYEGSFVWITGARLQTIVIYLKTEWHIYIAGTWYDIMKPAKNHHERAAG